MGARCLVIGAGKMGAAHLHALAALGVEALAAWAPSERHAERVRAVGAEFLEGALEDALYAFAPTHVVVASPVETLAPVAMRVMAMGVPDVLIEKPVAMSVEEGRRVEACARSKGTRVLVGYNRRFYASVRTALARLRARGEQVESVLFEFNETFGVGGPPGHTPEVGARWVLANSLHVIDLGLLPVGWPVWQRSRFGTTGSQPWHPSASVFAGAGETAAGAGFSYHANWNGPGRWAVEWVSPSERFVFRPLEQLAVLGRGDKALNVLPLIDDLDARFKPGVYLQAATFLGGTTDVRPATLADALMLLRLGEAVGGYPSSD